MFGFNKKKQTIKVPAEAVAGVEEYYKEQQKSFAAFDAALEPLRNERSKASLIIEQIYANHGIKIDVLCVIDERYLDDEVITDLHVFSEDEISSLRKWIPRYKNADAEIIKAIDEWHYGK